MRFLKHKEFVPFAPEQPGVVRVNHDSDDCSGDSNSMIVETRHDGSIFGYCHRCSKSGNYNSPFGISATRQSKHTSDGSVAHNREHRVRAYNRATTSTTVWSEEARRWIKQYGISEREVIANDIRYDKEIDGIFLSIRNADTTLGYILRRFNYSGPKYINDFTGDGDLCFVSRPPHDDSLVVLTEDVLSAIKVGRIANAVACLGTSPSKQVIRYLINNYDKFIIFFDDDNKIVKKQQRVLKNTLSLLGEARIITGVGRDPKELTNAQLQEIIYGVIHTTHT